MLHIPWDNFRYEVDYIIRFHDAVVYLFIVTSRLILNIGITRTGPKEKIHALKIYGKVK